MVAIRLNTLVWFVSWAWLTVLRVIFSLCIEFSAYNSFLWAFKLISLHCVTFTLVSHMPSSLDPFSFWTPDPPKWTPQCPTVGPFRPCGMSNKQTAYLLFLAYFACLIDQVELISSYDHWLLVCFGLSIIWVAYSNNTSPNKLKKLKLPKS